MDCCVKNCVSTDLKEISSGSGDTLSVCKTHLEEMYAHEITGSELDRVRVIGNCEDCNLPGVLIDGKCYEDHLEKRSDAEIKEIDEYEERQLNELRN